MSDCQNSLWCWAVHHVSGTEPMIYVILNTKEEAYQAIAEIFCLKSNDGSPFQIEINEQILINERRVAHRSWLKVAMLGVLAEPYDITRAFRKTSFSPEASMSFAALSPQLTSTSSGGVSIPFLHGTADSSPPTNRTANDATKSGSQQSVRSIPSPNNTDDWNPQIPRRPVPNPDPER